MKSNLRAALCIAALGAATSGCSDPGPKPQLRGPDTASTRTAPKDDATRATSGSLADAALADYRTKLLDIAFDAASRYPVNPHAKSRGRAQESVVVAALALRQPTRALRYTEGVDNWRRGACYAEFARYCVEHGATEGVEQTLQRALALSNTMLSSETEQTWRRDRIKAKVARAFEAIGQRARAAALQEGLVDSEKHRVGSRAPELDEQAAFDAKIAFVDDVLANGGFDQSRNALELCVDLFDRFYDDDARRDTLETRIRTGFKTLPEQVRFELLAETIERALAHEDTEKALALVEAADDVLARARWVPEDEIAFKARLAGLRYRAGDRDTARATLVALRKRFDEARDEIRSFWRGKALRPLAEAHALTDDVDGARRVYTLALSEGAINPNARPRANDFVATCLSMAEHGVEPDAEIWSRIEATLEGLQDPW